MRVLISFYTLFCSPFPPKMLPLLALNGPYHSARISASFGFKQTADSENVPHSKSCVSSLTSTFCYSPTELHDQCFSFLGKHVPPGTGCVQGLTLCRGEADLLSTRRSQELKDQREKPQSGRRLVEQEKHQ